MKDKSEQKTSIDKLPNREAASTVQTDGGSYVNGDVSANSFIGRDDNSTINNYFVEGLSHIPVNYNNRIQNFLNEYLGTKRGPVPFGGRQQQIDELNAWLDDEHAPPYYLINSEAGRGKSALVCRWFAQLTNRKNLAVIFVPISIRFETATKEVVFAALAAQLAAFYENESEKILAASPTAEQRKGVCECYLRRSPQQGKKLLVILDGLDEAISWEIGRSLFDNDPPHGLYVLVTARSRPSESGVNRWAAMLGWENPKLARITTLPPLTRYGLDEALRSLGNSLEHLASSVDIIGELYRLSEGDPLLVRLYLDALMIHESEAAPMSVKALARIKPGLAGCRSERQSHTISL